MPLPGRPVVSEAPRLITGLLAAALAVGIAFAIHSLVPAIPLLTAAVALGILVAQFPSVRSRLDGPLASGLQFSARSLMRIGIVLLGLKLSLIDIGRLGWVAIVVIVCIVSLTLAGTYWLGRAFRLPGNEPLLIATGFAICGASAIGAMGAVTGSKREEQATPVALVTLCGTLAIAILPLLQVPLGLSSLEFGHWVGAGVHDVGQVVATAQTAGSSALAIAVVVKLTRVLMLAPVVATASIVLRRRDTAVSGAAVPSNDALPIGPIGDPVPYEGKLRSNGRRPPLVPLFVAGFIGAVLLRSFIWLPTEVTDAADTVQTVLLGMALFALGTSVRVSRLVRTGGRALAVGLLSWLLIAGLALVAARL